MATLGRPAVYVLAGRGLPLARRIAAALNGAEIHGADSVGAVNVKVRDPRPHIERLFRDGRPIVGVCASGILLRFLGPLLCDKGGEPPVIAVAEDGSAVVPLVGGHRGGNALAHRIGEALGVRPAITTASEARFGIALDEPSAGLTLANPEDHKAFAATLLEGATVRVAGEAAWPVLTESALNRGDGPLAITITARRAAGASDHLVYHPRVLAIGVGCERDAPADDVVGLVRAVLYDSGYAEAAVAGVYSIDLKIDEPAVHAAAASLGVPARFFGADALKAETPRLANPSEVVFGKVGAHGVAEAAALAAAGRQARLVVAKHRGARATCAVAEAPLPFDGAAVGQARGRLAIVGLGPGGRDWRTPEAERLLLEAEDVVGYRRYLELIGPMPADKRLHAFSLGEEEARARRALDLAAAGRSVALVSSGDAGIYAMASLVWELLDREARADWRRIELAVAPGVSALQAAAARVGAPLGHDFCAVSLSDLLTPWPVIERRLRAAAEADFVVALYNPVSSRRKDQLVRARDILLVYRAPDTPVVLARQLGRAGERVDIVKLAELTPDSADMLTILLIGSSQTRLATAGRRVWVYTPRGYAAKGSRAP